MVLFQHLLVGLWTVLQQQATPGDNEKNSKQHFSNQTTLLWHNMQKKKKRKNTIKQAITQLYTQLPVCWQQCAPQYISSAYYKLGDPKSSNNELLADAIKGQILFAAWIRT